MKLNYNNKIVNKIVNKIIKIINKIITIIINNKLFKNSQYMINNLFFIMIFINLNK